MKQRKIWLALPCYGATLTVATMRSILYDMQPLLARGDMVRIFDECGHADIYSLRAQIVSHFLSDPDATDLVMIDNDVAWDALGLVKLLDHDVDLVAAPYPKRDYPLQFMFRSEMENGADLMGDAKSGLVEVWGMPAGFMRMKRSMLEKMVAHYSALESYDRAVPSERTTRLFDPLWWEDDEGRKRVLSEDYAFCQRWRDIGGKVWMDVNIPMAHIGTHAFAGCLGEFKATEKKDAA
jgi:hypothetical protein